MTVTTFIMGRVWRIESDLSRRSLLPLAVLLVVILRVIGWALAPVVLLVIVCIELAKAIGEVAQGAVIAVVELSQGESAEWRRLKRAVRLVWSTSFPRRPPDSVLLRKDGAA